MRLLWRAVRGDANWRDSGRALVPASAHTPLAHTRRVGQNSGKLPPERGRTVLPPSRVLRDAGSHAMRTAPHLWGHPYPWLVLAAAAARTTHARLSPRLVFNNDLTNIESCECSGHCAHCDAHKCKTLPIFAPCMVHALRSRLSHSAHPPDCALPVAVEYPCMHMGQP